MSLRSVIKSSNNSPTGLNLPAQLQIGELKLQLSIQERPGVRRNQLCKEVIEQLWTSEQKNQLQLKYISERSVEKVHIRRTRLHDDHWLQIYESYTDKQFIQEFGIERFRAYQEHVRERGRGFRWKKIQLTFDQRDKIRREETQYLPVDRALDYPKINILY